MGQATEEELLEQLRRGSKEGRILGNENFIKDVLKQNSETVPATITIKQLVDVAAHFYKVSPLEMTSASRSRHLAEAKSNDRTDRHGSLRFIYCQILHGILAGICRQ